MSTRCSVLYGGPFHLFKEGNNDMRLTLCVYGQENDFSGGVYVESEDMVQFAKMILHWADTGKKLAWVYEDTLG